MRIETVRDFAERVGRSHSSVSQAIKEGRIPPDAIKRHPKTGRVVGIYWRQALVDYRNNTDQAQAFRTGARPLTGPPAPVAHPEVDFVYEMFEKAREALDAGEFEKIEPAMRAALRQVPKESRHLVMLQRRVMDRLIQPVERVLLVLMKVEPEIAGDAANGMSDAEADEMGQFWYSVAAGEWQAADKGRDG
jgi:hypothetical protein